MKTGTCYFCGKKTAVKYMVKCNDDSCDADHVICDKCLNPAIENTMNDIAEKHRRGEI
jgi:hypothetical protein